MSILKASTDHPPPEEPTEVKSANARRSTRAVRVRFSALLLRVPRYLKLAYQLIRDDRLTPAQRALAAAGAAYTISPLDPVPGIIPVVGQLDDLTVLLLSLRQALRGSPPEIAAEHLGRVGLSFATIDADLQTVRATAVWLAQTGGKLVRRPPPGRHLPGRLHQAPPRLQPLLRPHLSTERQHESGRLMEALGIRKKAHGRDFDHRR
jgi:uncharacterized membrane protein YkvA (DUF1232 family)